MAMPRKGTRRIVVDGVRYRWRGSRESLVVQHEESPGAMLVVPLNRSWIDLPPLPAEVADLVRQALRAGWRASENGPAFHLPTPPVPPPRPQVAEPGRTAEADWLAATDPLWLLHQVHADPDGRQALLLTAAAFRLAWAHLPATCRDWVAAIERVAEGDGKPEEINDGEVFGPVRNALRNSDAAPTSFLRRQFELLAQVADTEWIVSQPPAVAPEVGAAVAHLVRDVFASPFREVVLRRSGLNPTIKAIAATIYAEQTFADLPILADALDDAECADAAILEHLREPGPHVRGCWALDLVLGKEEQP